MSRAHRREMKKLFSKDITEFLKVQYHFLPNFIDELGKIKDPRNNSYTDYDIEEILYTIIMKNACSISSMQAMTDEFNNEECVRNLCLILGKERKRISSSLCNDK